MNVESVLIVPQSSKTKSGKTDVLKDSFFQLYEKSIHGEEQNKSKVDNANENMPVQSMVLDEKNANGLEEVETSETVGKETAVDEINTAGMPFHIDAYRNKQVNFSTFGMDRSEQNQRQSNTEDTSDLLSTAKDKANIDSTQGQLYHGLPIKEQVNMNMGQVERQFPSSVISLKDTESSLENVDIANLDVSFRDIISGVKSSSRKSVIGTVQTVEKELLTNRVNESKSSTVREDMNIETTQIEVKPNPDIPKMNSLGTNSKNIQLVKEQTNLDTSFTGNKIRKEVSFEENIRDIVEAAGGKQEKILPQVNLQNINDTITHMMRTTTQGETSVMKVELYPKELGSVEVMVKMKEGKWTTKVLVEHEEIKELFTNQVNESRGSVLKQNQINVDTEFMIKENLPEEVSSKKNMTDPTKTIKDQDEGSSIMGKQDVNFNVRELGTKQINHVSHAKEVVLPEENLQKVNDSIVKLIETTTQGNVRVMKVKLYPEELGNVDVTLKMEDGKIIAKILVDNEQTKQLFTSKINELNTNLFKQNINIDKIQIDVNSSAHYSGGSNQNKGSYSKRNNRSPFDSKSADNMTTQDKAERLGAISILA